VHSWTPAAVGILNILGGAFAIIANPLAGRLSDRKGRRPVAMIFAICYVLAVGFFYSATGMILPLLWVVMIFFVFGSDVTQTAYSTELFPTDHRSTASGFRNVIGTMGGIVGLSSISALFVVFQSNWTSVIVLSLVGLLIPILVWLFLPETSNRTLEETSGDNVDQKDP
jgi:MFS family permease